MPDIKRDVRPPVPCQAHHFGFISRGRQGRTLITRADRIALANGYIANGWRRRMIRPAKAHAAKPGVAARLREFRVVSTGEDVSAQLAAINGFIDAGFDAVSVDAENPDALRPAIAAPTTGRRHGGTIF